MKPPIHRVPGTAIFLNASGETTPLALRSVVEHTHALPEKVLIVSIVSRSVPHVLRDRRFAVKRMGRGRCQILHVVIGNGYRDTNSVPELLQLARKLGHLERNLDLEGASYFISRMTITETTTPEMATWRKKLFLAHGAQRRQPDRALRPADRQDRPDGLAGQPLTGGRGAFGPSGWHHSVT